MFQHPLIIVAMDAEREAILAGSHLKKKTTVHKKLGIFVDEATFCGHHIYVAKSGVGLVNAAITVLLAADRYPLDAIFLMGVAGALVPQLNIGDLVIPTHVLQHDSYFTGGTDEGFMAPGKLYGSLAPEDRELPEIPVSPALLNFVEKACQRSRIPFHSGLLLSGSEFVGSPERKLALAEKINEAVAIEMEAAGVVQIALKLGLPFVIVKGIADRLTPEGEVIQDYKRFLSSAASNTTKVLQAIFEDA